MKTAQYYYNEANKLRDNYSDFGISEEEYFEAISKFSGSEEEAKEEVVRLYKKAIELDPDFADAYIDLGYLCTNTIDQAEYFDKGLSIFPENEIHYYKIGFYYLQSLEEEKAITIFSRGLKIFPDSWMLLSFRAVAYSSDEKIEEAIVDINTAIKLDPSRSFMYLYRGNFHEQKGDIPNAIKDWKKEKELGGVSGASKLEEYS